MIISETAGAVKPKQNKNLSKVLGSKVLARRARAVRARIAPWAGVTYSLPTMRDVAADVLADLRAAAADREAVQRGALKLIQDLTPTEAAIEVLRCYTVEFWLDLMEFRGNVTGDGVNVQIEAGDIDPMFHDPAYGGPSVSWRGPRVSLPDEAFLAAAALWLEDSHLCDMAITAGGAR